MKSEEKIIIAFVTGLAVGAFVGILFAPHKGSKTRRIINEEGQKMMDSLRDRFPEEFDMVSDLKDEIVQAVKDTKDGLTKES